MSFVQGWGVRDSWGVTTSVLAPTGATVGNLLIATIYGSDSYSTVSAGWTPLVLGDSYMQAFYKYVDGDSSDTISVDHPSSQYFRIVIQELSGVVPSDPIDSVVFVTASRFSGGTGNVSWTSQQPLSATATSAGIAVASLALSHSAAEYNAYDPSAGVEYTFENFHTTTLPEHAIGDDVDISWVQNPVTGDSIYPYRGYLILVKVPIVEEIRYINLNSTAGGDGTTSGTTGPNRAYPSLSSWFSAEQKDLVSLRRTHVVKIVEGEYTGEVYLRADYTDWTFSRSSRLKIQAIEGHECTTYDISNGVRFTATTADFDSAFTLANNLSFITLQGIGIKNNASASFNNADAFASTYSFHEGRKVSRCIFSSSGGAGYQQKSDAIVEFENCIAVNCKTSGFLTGNFDEVGFYNCTSINNGGYGFLREGTSGTSAVAINCVAYNCGLGGFSGRFSTTLCSHNAADDSSPPGVNVVSTTVSSSDFTNYAGNDFSVSLGSVLRTAGTPLRDRYTYDFLGNPRGGWDVGAYEYQYPYTVVSISPEAAEEGDSVTVSGVNFGASSGSVYLNTTPNTDVGGVLQTSVTSWTTSSITFGLSGLDAVNVPVKGREDFVVIKHPTLAFNPASSARLFVAPVTEVTELPLNSLVDAQSWSYFVNGSASTLSTTNATRSWGTDANTTPSTGYGPTGPMPGEDLYVYVETSSPAVSGDFFDAVKSAAFDSGSATRVMIEINYFCRSTYPIGVSLAVRKNGSGSPLSFSSLIAPVANAANGWTVFQSNDITLPDGPGLYDVAIRVSLGSGTIWQGDPAFDYVKVYVPQDPPAPLFPVLSLAYVTSVTDSSIVPNVTVTVP